MNGEHTKVSFHGPSCSCGGRGCLEAYIGGVALAGRWIATGRTGGDDVEATVTDLFARAAAGDSVANAVVDETTEILGLGLANLVNLFNPERIVVGGWLGVPLIGLRKGQLDSEIKRQALNRPAQQVTLAPCRFGGDAVALGAALLPLEHFIAGTIGLPEKRSMTAIDDGTEFTLRTEALSHSPPPSCGGPRRLRTRSKAV